MPIGRSAKKSLRKARKLNEVNTNFRKNVKKVVKGFTQKPSEETWKKVSSILDKAIKKNILHRNKVARLKSRYSKMIKATTTKKVEPKTEVVKVKKTVKRTAKEKMSK